MSTRVDPFPRAFAASLALAGVATVVASALIWGARGFPLLPTTFARSLPGVTIGMAAALCYVGVGWLLASRTPGNPIGWLLLAMGLVLAAMAPIGLLVDAAHLAYRSAPAVTLIVAWLFSSFSTPALAGMVLVAGLLFPDGRLVGARGRLAVLLTVVAVGVVGAAAALDPTGLGWYSTLPNPFAGPSALKPLLSAMLVVGVVLLIGAIAGLVASLVTRYRRGDATVQAQTRWMVFASAVSGVAFVPFVLARYLVPVSQSLGELLAAVAQAGTAMLPIAAAVAITRHGLFGIDFIISRTLVYVPLMAILGGMYTASVAIFQRIFVAVTGTTSDAALVITIFLVAAAFTPVRRALEGTVDRWIRAGGAGVSGHDAAVATARVASEIVALRMFEERVAGRAASGTHGARRDLPIDAEGLVSCPSDGKLKFVGCLGCPYLGAIVTTPPKVVCNHPATSATVGQSGSGADRAEQLGHGRGLS